MPATSRRVVLCELYSSPCWAWVRRCSPCSTNLAYRMWEYKRFEMDRLGHVPVKIPAHPGQPDPRVKLYE